MMQLAQLAAHGGIEAGITAPAAVTITDESSSDTVALGRRADSATPSLTVFFEALNNVPEMNQFLLRDHLISVGIRFDRDDDEAALNVAAISLLFRALVRTLGEWFRTFDVSTTARNGVQFVAPHKIETASFAPSITSQSTTFGMRVVFQIRDALPATV